MGIIQEKGINDMPYGWYSENKWNKICYTKWYDMLRRCYDDKCHEKQPTYINASLQLEMHWLSYFVEHIKEIDGYDEEKFLNGELVLDKDIKSNGRNHEYSIENCMFVSNSENSRQANSTREYLKGKDNRNYGKRHSEETKQKLSNILSDGRLKREKHSQFNSGTKICQRDDNMNLIKIWINAERASEELKLDKNNIRRCCRFWELDCNKEEWYKMYKYRPSKHVGGFVWTYYKEDGE